MCLLNTDGAAYVCVPLMTAMFSTPVGRMEIIKGKMCTVALNVILAQGKKSQNLPAPA